MKKYLSISLLLLYLASTIGIQISLHYCENELAAVTLIDKASCCCDQDAEPNDCCKDEFKVFKINDEQEKIEPSFKQKIILVEAIIASIYHYKPRVNVQKLICKFASRPPPPEAENTIPLYKKYHSYLYYS